MSNVTRRALRVYMALSELKQGSGDVLDALVPFFEPILAVMHGKVFDPELLAKGARKLYRWRINRDIAEAFIPRLVKKGYIQRKANGVYVVDYQQPADAKVDDISNILEKIIDEFEKFPPRVTDLLNYHRSREELTEILIRFLLSLDAYGEAAFAAQVDRMFSEEERQVLDQLEEGGKPLPNDDRYMSARFVKQMCTKKPEYVPHFARLASIALLTEVVEDFVKPTQPATNVNLTVVLDGPVALDYLGCSGKRMEDDVRSIIDSLRGIGCTIVVYPMTIGEIQNNLTTMLSRPHNKRFGATHAAMGSGEVMESYVQAVAKDPELALDNVRIPVRAIDLDQFPNQQKWFDQERHDDFLNQVVWGSDVAAKEHDATALTLTMRLREGRHSSDLFRCRYVFVTRNATFERTSRRYCLQSQLLNQVQTGPVVHLRELATLAWLRTGLGPAGQDIPKAHLLATCDRVLRARTEVQDAVAAKLQEATPEKMPQFQLLIQDHRSIQRLADETLNDEHVVTAENANQLLEAMRQATIEEEKAAMEAEKSAVRQRANRRHKADQTALKDAEARADAATSALAGVSAREQGRVARAIARTNRLLAIIDRTILVILLIMGGTGAYDFLTGGSLKQYLAWKVVLGIAGAFGLYHLIAHIRGAHVLGTSNFLNWLGKRLLRPALARVDIEGFDIDKEIEFVGGQARRKGSGGQDFTLH
ncbi:hypothetical protein [Bradyrhizobium sp. 21]|uniref:hypothetical protein n=1 Tax=Bradyrhizobium sp. 21 TaxID=2782666 RepID=UPI001FF83BA8|nr:hypothetical protein [Bradyrhizobium sp. 21]MCK1386429.1 hypothetical protein [Bradyrhizobium sp. 21]